MDEIRTPPTPKATNPTAAPTAAGFLVFTSFSAIACLYRRFQQGEGIAAAAREICQDRPQTLSAHQRRIGQGRDLFGSKPAHGQDVIAGDRFAGVLGGKDETNGLII